MARPNSAGLPHLTCRSDAGQFTCHRSFRPDLVPFLAGVLRPSWSPRAVALVGRRVIKVSLATGDQAMARVRWNRVHEQVEGLVQMGQVLATEKGRRERPRQTVDRLPAGAVSTRLSIGAGTGPWIGTQSGLWRNFGAGEDESGVTPAA